MRLRVSLFEALLVAAILGVHLYAATADAYAFPNYWFIRDDAYYYFKVAQNISAGIGSAFDGINLTNGYHPLWLALNIPIFALARYDLILPLRILLMVIAGIHAASAVLIYRLTKRALTNAVAIFAALFWAFNGYLHFAFYRPGLETPLAVLTILLLTERLSRFESEWRTQPVRAQSLFGLAFLSALVMFSRLDLIFLAALAGVYIIFRGHPLRYLLPLDVTALFLSATSAAALRVGFPAYNLYADSAVTTAALALFFKLPVFYFAGLYQHPNSTGVKNLLVKTLLAGGIGGALLAGATLLLNQINPAGSYPPSALLVDFILTTALSLLIRLMGRGFGNPKPAPRRAPLEEFRKNWRNWLYEGSIYYATVGGALGAYMLLNKIIFGTSSPVSGQIKRWWGTLLHSVYDNPAAGWLDFFGIGYDTPYNVWRPLSIWALDIAKRIKPLYPGSNTTDERYYIVMGALALISALMVAFNARRVFRASVSMALLPLLAGSAAQTLSYTATAYGGAKEWYWIGQALLIVFGFSLLADLAARPLTRLAPLRWALYASALAGGLWMFAQLGVFFSASMTHGYYPPEKPYMEVVAYLEENTPPGIVIGMTGGGNVGYFIQDRVITNMDGLINSYEYFRALQQKQAPQYLYQRGMRVVFSNKKILEYPPYDKQFAPYLSAYSVYGGKDLMWLLPEPKY